MRCCFGQEYFLLGFSYKSTALIEWALLAKQMRITQFAELPAKSMGLYHFNLLLGTWNTLKAQTGTVASHQILNQIQFKEKDFSVFPVSRLMGIPFTSFAQDCTRERFNTGNASLKEGPEVFYCISHTSFSSKTDDCCRQGLRDTVLRQKYKSASHVFTRGAAVHPSLKSN